MLFPMEVTLVGIVTLLRFEQDVKAESPILVTLFGMAMLARGEDANAACMMLATLLGTR